MILSNVEIHRAIDEGRLKISPDPQPRFPSVDNPNTPYDTHSVDIRLGDEISIPQGGLFSYDHTQPGELSELLTQNTSKRTLRNDQPFRLDYGRFILGITLESIELPIDPAKDTCLAARIEGKSSRARCGLLIHFTAPTVHPGFNGPLVLEMINLGHAPILLTPEMYIAQLIVEEVKGIPAKGSPSEFQDQSNPDGRKKKPS
jgi:dCTP deaminase